MISIAYHRLQSYVTFAAQECTNLQRHIITGLISLSNRGEGSRRGGSKPDHTHNGGVMNAMGSGVDILHFGKHRFDVLILQPQ